MWRPRDGPVRQGTVGEWSRCYIVTEGAGTIILLICHNVHKQQPPVPPDIITLTSGPSFIELVPFLITVSQENLFTQHSM